MQTIDSMHRQVLLSKTQLKWLPSKVYLVKRSCLKISHNGDTLRVFAILPFQAISRYSVHWHWGFATKCFQESLKNTFPLLPGRWLKLHPPVKEALFFLSNFTQTTLSLIYPTTLEQAWIMLLHFSKTALLEWAVQMFQSCRLSWLISNMPILSI